AGSEWRCQLKSSLSSCSKRERTVLLFIAGLRLKLAIAEGCGLDCGHSIKRAPVLSTPIKRQWEQHKANRWPHRNHITLQNCYCRVDRQRIKVTSASVQR